jgi:hypothetical protein
VTVPVIGGRAAEGAEDFSLVVTPTADIAAAVRFAAGRAVVLDTDAPGGPAISVEGGTYSLRRPPDGAVAPTASSTSRRGRTRSTSAASTRFAPGDQAFQFIRGRGFSDTPGELPFDDGRLQADVNGDGRADFEIVVSGIDALNRSDLLL